jgi:transposase
MIALPAGVQVYLATGATDMRKGFDGLAALVQTQLSEDPFSGQLFVFRGRAGDRVKILWWCGDGLCLFREAPGARTLCLATSYTWNGEPDSRAAVDAVGRDRLAPSGAIL